MRRLLGEGWVVLGLLPFLITRRYRSPAFALLGVDQDGQMRDLRLAIEEKQRGTDAVFLAILSEANGCAEGYASYMRMEPEQAPAVAGNANGDAAAAESDEQVAALIRHELPRRRVNAPLRRAGRSTIAA